MKTELTMYTDLSIVQLRFKRNFDMTQALMI